MKRIVSFLIVIVILVLVAVVNHNMTENAIKSCIEGGNNYNMCINKLK